MRHRRSEHLVRTGDGTSEAEAQRATAGRLALEVMHEIRNPLETLGYLNYLALQEADDPTKVRTYMLMAEEQIQHLCQIANQTLSFARPSPDRKAIDLVTLVHSAIRIHQRTIQTKRIHLDLRLPKNLVAYLQGSRMLQVLSNLIANALESMPECGQMIIRVKKHAGCIDVVVADNGYGISPGSLAKLFRPFFTTRKSDGNGLGLSLSKRIVEEHGGKLLVRSSVRPSRTGSVFRVRLPQRSDMNLETS